LPYSIILLFKSKYVLEEEPSISEQKKELLCLEHYWGHLSVIGQLENSWRAILDGQIATLFIRPASEIDGNPTRFIQVI
jgi:hypothetical protein